MRMQWDRLVQGPTVGSYILRSILAYLELSGSVCVTVTHPVHACMRGGGIAFYKSRQETQDRRGLSHCVAVAALVCRL